MRALRTDGRVARLVDNEPDPTLKPNEALLHPTRVLLGPPDAHAAQSGRFVGVLGHRCVCVVKKVHIPADAPAVMQARKSWIGRRVIVSPTVACAACDLCRAGLSPHCRARRIMGIHERDGCCAESVCAPLQSLHAVPERVADDAAILACPIASAAHAVNMLRGEGRSYVTVLGDSVLALLTAQLLSRRNAAVRLLSDRDTSAALCERWGVKQRRLAEPGRRQDQDVVVDCTGSHAGLRLAMQMVRPRGMIVLKCELALTPFPPGAAPGPTSPGSPWGEGVDLTPAITNEVQIVGSRDGPIPDALELLAANRIDTFGLIARRFKLDQSVEALRQAAEPEQLGVIIEA